MDFINSLKDGFKKTTDKAIKVSNDVIEITKLTFAISDVNSNIEKKFKEIGHMVYESYTKDEGINVDIEGKCEEIGKAYVELENLKIKMRVVRKVKLCGTCSEENPCENIYCRKCGTKLTENKAQDADTEQ